jgi:hypothetical protein
MVDNKKKETYSPQSDIHTIVDLPIEAVLAHLSALTGEKYKITIERHNSDEASFELSNKQSHDQISVLAKGIVQRWNGTFTRIDSDIKIKFIRYTSFPLFLVALLAILALPPLLYFIDRDIQAVFNFTICFLPIAFVGVAVMGAMVNHGLAAFNMERLKASKPIVQELADELGVKLQEKAATLDFDGT